jgi:hypothetical protein
MGSFISSLQREIKEWDEPYHYYDPTGSDVVVTLNVGDEEAICIPIRNNEYVNWEEDTDIDPVDSFCMKHCMQYRFYLTHDHTE